MFVLLLFILASCCSLLTFIYARPRQANQTLTVKSKVLIYALWGSIYLLSLLCCNYLAAIGLPFSQISTEVSLLDTISTGYIIHFIQVSIIIGLLGGGYYLIRKFCKIPQYFFIIFLGAYALGIYYPGLPYADTTDLYQYFMTGQYSDWQPPLFTLSWKIFRFYGAAFLYNTLSYYIGLTVISYYLYTQNKNWQNDLLVLFSLNPLLFTQLNILLKDTLFAGLLIDNIAILLFLNHFKSRAIKIGLMGLFSINIFMVIGVRYNGVSAVIPLLGAFFWYALAKTRLSKLKNTLVCLSLAIITALVMVQINIFLAYDVFQAKKAYSPTLILYNDMANIECRSGHNFQIPAELFVKSTPADQLRQTMCSPSILNEFNYDPIFIPNWNNGGNPALLNYDSSEQSYLLAKKNWQQAVLNYPFTYLYYRLRFFANDFFATYYMPAFAPVAWAAWPGDLNKPAEASNFQLLNQQVLAQAAMAEKVDIRFILSLLTLSGMIALGVYYLTRREFSISLVIWLSNLLTLAGLFLVTGEHPARFFLWSYIAVILAIILITPRKLK